MKLNLPSFLALASMSINGALAGINCNGSGACPVVSGTLGKLLGYANSIDPNRWYTNGENIVCQKNELGTGLCAFLQNTGGAPGSSIKPLLEQLSYHGCNKCGSIPLFYPQGDNNDADHGVLTVNAVGGTNGCNGVC
ncbi:hypothetical protein FP744_10003474 [Trichoderma asperellum]|nr:killer toxin [Trichoderma asperelloides]